MLRERVILTHRITICKAARRRTRAETETFDRKPSTVEFSAFSALRPGAASNGKRLSLVMTMMMMHLEINKRAGFGWAERKFEPHFLLFVVCWTRLPRFGSCGLNCSPIIYSQNRLCMLGKSPNIHMHCCYIYLFRRSLKGQMAGWLQLSFLLFAHPHTLITR